ncbi:MAG: hypothetical protein U0269_23435 [Polyangiales bacterium]
MAVTLDAPTHVSAPNQGSGEPRGHSHPLQFRRQIAHLNGDDRGCDREVFENEPSNQLGRIDSMTSP